MQKRLLVAVGTGVLLLATACSSGGDSTPRGDGPTKVSVALSDFKIAPSERTIPTGKVSFEVTGKGPSSHEMVVLRTDLKPGQIPVTDGEANEDADGLVALGEVEGVANGDVKNFTLDLAPGRYLFLCNEPGHFLEGMYTFVQVI